MHKNLTKSLFIGKRIIYLPTCHSTNDEAARMLSSQKIFEGDVLITDDQRKGKGQRGNHWESEAGKNLTFSLILRPHFLSPLKQFYLNMAVCLGVRAGLSRWLGDEVEIKWPNDIYCEKKKLGGTLIESSIKQNMLFDAIIGVGINVNQKKFDAPLATSLFILLKQNKDKNEVLEAVLMGIEKFYLMLKQGSFDEIKDTYYRHLMDLNNKRVFEDTQGPFVGTIRGVSDQGKLQIERGEDLVMYDLKEVKFL